jgi:hypothetical protein
MNLRRVDIVLMSRYCSRQGYGEAGMGCRLDCDIGPVREARDGRNLWMNRCGS